MTEHTPKQIALADAKSCDHDWRYEGTDYHGSHKGEDVYTCQKCRERQYIA